MNQLDLIQDHFFQIFCMNRNLFGAPIFICIIHLGFDSSLKMISEIKIIGSWKFCVNLFIFFCKEIVSMPTKAYVMVT